MSRLLPSLVLVKLGMRLLVAGALLAFVFRLALFNGEEPGGGLAALRSAWHAEPMALFVPFGLAVAVLGTGFATNAWRFSGLLSAAGLPARWSTVLRAYLVGSFFNLVLPGAILGDAYRVVDVRRDTGAGSRALGLVMLERMLGLTALGSIGLITMPFVPLGLENAYMSWILVGLSGSFLVATCLALHPRSNAWLLRILGALLRRLPRARSVGERVLREVGAMWRRPRTLLRTYGLSLIAQGLLVLAIWILSHALKSQVDWYWFPVIIPFATLVSLAPISIGAAGVREFLYITLFGAAGMTREGALALALSVFLVTLVWGLVGLVIFIAGRRAERAQ